MQTKLESLYLFNATVLICHEIDSAFWHEWLLFRLPGGIQLFLFLHLLLLPLLLLGYREVCLRARRARLANLLLGGVGLFAAVIHAAFIAVGDAKFSLPLSQALLAATFILSLFQLALAWRQRPEGALPTQHEGG